MVEPQYWIGFKCDNIIYRIKIYIFKITKHLKK
jgi:hypothetical protein